MQCGICNSSRKRKYLQQGKFHLVKCLECGLVYVENFHAGDISYADDRYFTERNQYVRRWDEFCALFELLLDKVHRFKQTGRLLDVGAGVGCLAYTAARKGFDVYGVEVSEWASGFARREKGLNILTGKIEDVRFAPEYFDIVVINHVLEHVENPRMMLGEIGRILKPDGVLVVGVPNIGSIMALIKSSRWASLLPEQHIWHFSPPTLRKLLKVSGFRELYFEAKENHPVIGWGPRSMLKRALNAVAVLINRSEAMLMFCSKA